MALQEYNRKRKFTATPEPRGEAANERKGDALRFVVQLHHARARHYDFRLEVDGVLRSWAVPKGPSFRPGESRLAIEVEDHPLSYRRYEGTIPEGNYGAGHVAIFDEGIWEPEGDPIVAIQKGKLEFELRGERLKGRWHLARIGRPASKPQWVLLKRNDEYAADLEADDLLQDIPSPPADAPGASTAKGRGIVAAKAKNANVVPPGADKTPEKKAKVRSAKVSARRKSAVAQGQPDRGGVRATALALAGGRKARGGEFEPPMLTTAAKSAPVGEQWLHEWKWDGYRIIAQTGDTPLLWSRNGLPWANRVPELAHALSTLGVAAMLDGELIAVDARGRSDFNALQQALKGGKTAQLRYAVFDLLHLEGSDLTRVPLIDRKRLLESLLQGADARLFYSAHVSGHGPEVFEAARAQGMEGIISKRAESTYSSGRSDQWLKIKAVETREFIVVGYTQPKGTRQGIGALLLAQKKGSGLVYAGRVGSGLTDAMLRDLPKQLAKLESATPTVPLPAHTPLPPGNVHWVEPAMVVEVIFRGWGNEGLLRQASFHRVRPDKPVSDELDQPAPLPTLSSPGRVVYPDAGYTKQQVYDYYLAAADQILGDIRGRLLSIVRCPDGIGGQHFFQKHAGPGFGESIRRHKIRENDGDPATYFSVDDVAGLMNLVQMNALEFHPWGSRVETLEQPDRMVFDLDPDTSIAWTDIKAAAREVRARLDEIGLDSYPRLSGGKGMHVVVPIQPHADWAQVRNFCEAFASAMAQQNPERYVATMSKAKRHGRIFIDWLRNGRGATAIASWSLRARAGAPAAMPLTWEEFARIRRPDRYTLKDAAERGLPAFISVMTANAPKLPMA